MQHILAYELFNNWRSHEPLGRSHTHFVNTDSLDPKYLDSTNVILFTYSDGPYFRIPNLKAHVENKNIPNLPRFPSEFDDEQCTLESEFIFDGKYSTVVKAIRAVQQKLIQHQHGWRTKKRQKLEENGQKYLKSVLENPLYNLYGSILCVENFPIRVESVKSAHEFVDELRGKTDAYLVPNIDNVNKRLVEMYEDHCRTIEPTLLQDSECKAIA